MPRIYVHRFVVPADAIDVNSHVNNLAYLRWMQEVATMHSEAQGWSLQRYLAEGAGWFVRSHTIEYLRPAFAGEALAVYTWVSGITARSSPRRYRFVRASDGEPLARAETLWVFVDFATGRPVRIPAAVAEAFPVVPDDDAELSAIVGRRRRQQPDASPGAGG